MTDMYIIPCIDFVKGKYRDTEVLYYEYYDFFRSRKNDSMFTDFGFHVYALRHGDDGDWVVPVSIEYGVSVNYCGFIVSPVDLFDTYPEDVVNNEMILLTEDEGYDIIQYLDEDGEEGEFITLEQFMEELGIAI